jgi:hypothetical protein
MCIGDLKLSNGSAHQLRRDQPTGETMYTV